jgi:hypothetical protein
MYRSFKDSPVDPLGGMIARATSSWDEFMNELSTKKFPAWLRGQTSWPVCIKNIIHFDAATSERVHTIQGVPCDVSTEATLEWLTTHLGRNKVIMKEDAWSQQEHRPIKSRSYEIRHKVTLGWEAVRLRTWWWAILIIGVFWCAWLLSEMMTIFKSGLH